MSLSTTSGRSRRMLGALIGLVLGLVYGATAGSINAILLWGIPLQVQVGAVVFGTIFAGAGAMVTGSEVEVTGAE